MVIKYLTNAIQIFCIAMIVFIHNLSKETSPDLHVQFYVLHAEGGGSMHNMQKHFYQKFLFIARFVRHKLVCIRYSPHAMSHSLAIPK